ncbi:MAG: hypothetical protein IEMM0002_1445 [bacterium]|nr:MAG: hypothetical protein IEMM0002_1445 [bacterium]
MRLFTAVFILSFVFIHAADAERATENKTVYGELKTGLKKEHFKHFFPAFSETVKSNYLDLEQRSKTDFSIYIRRPEEMELADSYLRKIPTRILKVDGAEKCDFPINAVFLLYPESRSGKRLELLYSYDYLACAGGGEITPKRLFDIYMEKYGNYDEKDYDRRQHIYTKVATNHEVRVKPVSSVSGEAGLVITVIDETVLKKIYNAWRAWIRGIEKAAARKF